MKLYDLIFVQRWPWWVGGPLIGLFVLAFLFFKNRLLGASSTYQAVVEAAQGKGDPRKVDFENLSSRVDLPVDPRDPAPRWRVWFWFGLLFGGLLAGYLAGTWNQPLLPGLGEFLGLSVYGQLAVMFTGGILIGSGTRMGGGCTSGHGITGISSRQWPSLLATCTFMAVGIIVTFALQMLRGGR